MNCKCNEWLEGISQIAAAQVFCANQIAGPVYTATKFRFCPWCGKPLEGNDEIENEIELKTDSLLLQWAKESADELIPLEELYDEAYFEAMELQDGSLMAT